MVERCIYPGLTVAGLLSRREASLLCGKEILFLNLYTMTFLHNPKMTFKTSARCSLCARHLALSFYHR